MKQVFKYLVPIVGNFEILMPEGAEILTVGTQKERPFLWVLVDATKSMVVRYFKLFGTGQLIGDFLNIKYIGTFMEDQEDYVWHLFELIS